MAQDHMATAFHFLMSKRFPVLDPCFLGFGSTASISMSAFSDISALQIAYRALSAFGSKQADPANDIRLSLLNKQILQVCDLSNKRNFQRKAQDEAGLAQSHRSASPGVV